MKVILKYLILSLIAAVLFVACDSDVDFGEQYKKIIYIVNSNDIVHQQEYEFGVDQSINLSVYCGGTVLTDKDIEVKLRINTNVLDSINKVYAVADPFYLNKSIIPEANYKISDLAVTIKAGDEFGVLKIPFTYDGLSPDSIYVMPLSIVSNSLGHDINPKLNTIIHQVLMINKYSGLYTGSSKELPKTNRSVQPYLKAISANQVRMPIHNLPDKLESVKTNFMLLTIAEDDETMPQDSLKVSISGWNESQVQDMGDSWFYKEDMSYKLFYSFKDSNDKEFSIAEEISNMNFIKD